uniref:Uncharacterized protein n=1 Tax=Rangifer tarandus platyrhynchus TaxID=3082113 RepID=A0ACB0FGF8_RANTA|nr:unnamed protein product [Rangifer tarandus platyrhynchus]
MGQLPKVSSKGQEMGRLPEVSSLRTGRLPKVSSKDRELGWLPKVSGLRAGRLAGFPRGRTRLLCCRDVTHPGHSAASWRPRREKLRGLLLWRGMAATKGVTLLVLLLYCGQGAELPPTSVTSEVTVLIPRMEQSTPAELHGEPVRGQDARCADTGQAASSPRGHRAGGPRTAEETPADRQPP